jgi:hypothetical protein
MEKSNRRGCFFVLVCWTVTSCGSAQEPTDTTRSVQASTEARPDSAEQAAALNAALAATGNNYPTPALFVKRWNLQAQTLPEAQIRTFTSRGQENNPRPIADLDSFDFAGAERTSLHLGASGISIEYVTMRDDPLNIGAKERPNSYSITMKNQKPDGRVHPFTQFCLWEIRATRSSFTIRSAIDLFGDAAHQPRRSSATAARTNVQAEGVNFTLRKDNENSTCEVKEASDK